MTIVTPYSPRHDARAHRGRTAQQRPRPQRKNQHTAVHRRPTVLRPGRPGPRRSVPPWYRRNQVVKSSQSQVKVKSQFRHLADVSTLARIRGRTPFMWHNCDVAQRGVATTLELIGSASHVGRYHQRPQRKFWSRGTTSAAKRHLLAPMM